MGVTILEYVVNRWMDAEIAIGYNIASMFQMAIFSFVSIFKFNLYHFTWIYFLKSFVSKRSIF